MDYTKREWRVAETSPISSLVFIKQQDGIIAEASPYYAPLIVTAVNGCQAVNPNNPIVVAESIQDMYWALSNLVTFTLHETPELTRITIENAKTILAKVNGREVK